MATAKEINEAFLTIKSKNNLSVEKATKRNLDKISTDDISEIHSNIMNVFAITKNEECKYFDVNKFQKLIEKLREEKEEEETTNFN